jgi:hypothetical protein
MKRYPVLLFERLCIKCHSEESFQRKDDEESRGGDSRYSYKSRHPRPFATLGVTPQGTDRTLPLWERARLRAKRLSDMSRGITGLRLIMNKMRKEFYFFGSSCGLFAVKVQRVFVRDGSRLRFQGLPHVPGQGEHPTVAYPIVEFQPFERPFGNDFIHFGGF